MIEKERIEEVKRSVDLVALIESRGISLKKNGRAIRAFAPSTKITTHPFP